jgi:hypothetical protein
LLIETRLPSTAMTIPDYLLTAYLSTNYCVDLPQGRVLLRIGERAPALDAILEAHEQEQWAFVTAHNPGSRPDAPGNADRHAELLSWVQARGLPWFAARSVADDGGWPEEESLLIVGLAHEEARRLGRRFGQVAIVVGDFGGPALLLACDAAN